MKTYQKIISCFTASLILLLLPCISKAQIGVAFNLSRFEGGYNVSCNGGSDGSIEAIVVGDHTPFFFQWSNGATTPRIQSLQAGIYTLTITDFSNNTLTKEVELLQPSGMSVTLRPRIYDGGTNISVSGGHDGSIESNIDGGAPPYHYTWSNGSHEAGLGDLTVGTYSLTVTDATNCVATANVTLIEPTPLHIVSISSPLFRGYNIDCFGGHKGTINLTVAGGIPPYIYQWNNGSFDQNPTDLETGHYMVRVFDKNRAEVDGQITLTQPDELNFDFVKSLYSGDYNISCYNCANGTIQVTVNGGVSPFNYNWSNQQTNQNISNVAVGNYSLNLTDANGCEVYGETQMTQPEREDWTMSGNANTNPANQFIGTNDSTDVLFKTNNSERIRIKGNGKIKLNAYSGTNHGFLYTDSLGNISSRTIKTGIDLPVPCTGDPVIAFQQSLYNTADVFSCWRRFGIGTDYPTERLEVAGYGKFTNPTDHSSGLSLGNDGVNSIINPFGTGDLLINYNQQKSVRICTGASGDVEIGGNTYLATNHGKVGIKNPTPTYDLDVNGTINGSDIRINGNSIASGLWSFSNNNINYNSGKVGIKNPTPTYDLDVNGTVNALDLRIGGNSILGTLWTPSASGIYYMDDVSIGTMNSGKKLMVNGEVQLLGDGGSSFLDIKSDNGIPWRRGISIGRDNGTLIDGAFNFWIYKDQHLAGSTANFNFRATNNDNTSFTDLVTINGDGHMGIGNTDPKDALVVGNWVNTLSVGKADGAALNYGTSYIGFNATRESGSSWRIKADPIHNGGNVIWGTIGGDLVFSNINTTATQVDQILNDADVLNNSQFIIRSDGKVGIGNILNNMPGSYKLYVESGIITEKLKVSLRFNWADNVFSDKYKLMEISDLKQYIELNKHLPDVSSTADLKKSGIDLEEQLTIQMKKIEELNLYIIQLKDEIDQIKR